MKVSRMTYMRSAICLMAVLAVLGWSSTSHGQWTPLTNAPGAFLDTCVLLTDGTVICHVYNSNAWRRLTPDINGSYANGTWSSIANMPNGNDASFGCANCVYSPLYFASVVLPDGRVVVIGGEYVNLNPVWTNIGFMYTPTTNAWSAQLTEPFGGGCIGDASASVLADGTMILADGVDCTTFGNMASFNPSTQTFTALNPTGKADRNNEENWNLLPDGTILTVDARIQSQSEIYDPVANSWGDRTNTMVNLADTGTNTNSREVGPGVLRPGGTVVYFSGTNTGQNAVYDFNTGAWSNTAAMDFPLVPGEAYHFSVADGPASLLPNGNVLVMASPVTNVDCPMTPPPPPPTCGVFNQPSHFYEFDFATNSLAAVADSPNAASFVSYQGRMLLLPTGEVLLTAYDQGETQDVILYSDGGTPQDEWRPTITSCLGQVVAGETYSISGTLFHGLSEGASYGDDAQSSTNYPLVRIRNIATGHVFYCRTHDHSRMGVQFVGSTEITSTQFDTPAGLEPGPAELVVVVNGIASDPPLIINDNDAPSCDAGGPYLAQCTGTTTSVPLDGSGSSDPNAGDQLTYFWSTNCPGGIFDNNTIVAPILTLNTVSPCALNCTVSLTVSDCSGASTACNAAVTIIDNIDPVLNVPLDITIECDESTLPDNTGQATATDNCDVEPMVSHADMIVPGECPQEMTINRTWTATDDCGNDSSQLQVIEVVDTTNPVITCPENITIECINPSGFPSDFVAFDATATDNCDTEVTITDDKPNYYPPTCDQDGTVITFTATDDCGNFSQCQAVVRVIGAMCCPGVTDTDLKLMVTDLDLRQDNDGPGKTKARFDIWNSNEVRFSGTERCITCWDETLISDYGPIANHLIIENLQTDKGKARIQNEGSTVCPESTDAPLLGVAIEETQFLGSPYVEMRSAVTLVGMGEQAARIQYDIIEAPEEANDGGFVIGQVPSVGTTPKAPSLNTDDLSLAGGVSDNRASTTFKGSLVSWPVIEVKWDAAGTLIQDTIITVVNDNPGQVKIQFYQVNGDAPLDPVIDQNSMELIERGHPGWNWSDYQITLTGDESAYWSIATGWPKGVSPISVLDSGNPNGRPDIDPSNPGGRVIRGFLVGWAVNDNGQEIRWNHLKGHAIVIRYDQATAFDYNPWNFRVVSGVPEGAQSDGDPGSLNLDGLEYDYAPESLLFDFFAAGTRALSHPAVRDQD